MTQQNKRIYKHLEKHRLILKHYVYQKRFYYVEDPVTSTTF